jgi:hypothetical protein
MHSSHYTNITVVRPLLGYVHKDLALGSFIIIVMSFRRRVLTISSLQVRSIRGELDRTMPYNLRFNPQIYLPSSLLCSTDYNNWFTISIKTLAYRIRPCVATITVTNNSNNNNSTTLDDTFVSIFIHFGLFNHLQCITKTLTLPTLGLPPMRVLFFLQLSLSLCTRSCMHACCSFASC